MRKSYIVTVEVNPNMWPSEVQTYIRDAIKYHRDKLHPDDRMARLDRSKITVRPQKK
jgi:hypothetical protein